MSVINLGKKYYYIHVPKTAGGSMESIVGGFAHLTYNKIKDIAPDIDSYFGFTFVRNPWTRVLSSFYHQERLGNEIFESNNYEKSKEGFVKFVREVMRPAIGYEKDIHWYPLYPTKIIHHHFLPQYFFLCQDDVVNLDFVGRFETLNDDWSYISKKFFGEVKDLPVKNKSKSYSNFMSHFEDEDVVRIVQDFYEKDFSIFGYSKDPRDAIER